MIVQTTDFKGHLLIPNLEGSAPLEIGNFKELELYIQTEEPKLLIKLFGYELAKEISSKVDAEGGIIDGTEQEFIDLIHGKDDYIGLSQLMANYIYTIYIKDHDEELGGVGVVKEKSKGADSSSIRNKYIRAYREYFELTVGHETTPNLITRDAGRGIIWSSNEYYAYKPLRVYMDENSDVFPTTVNRFHLIKNENYYGI